MDILSIEFESLMKYPLVILQDQRLCFDVYYIDHIDIRDQMEKDDHDPQRKYGYLEFESVKKKLAEDSQCKNIRRLVVFS